MQTWLARTSGLVYQVCQTATHNVRTYSIFVYGRTASACNIFDVQVFGAGSTMVRCVRRYFVNRKFLLFICHAQNGQIYINLQFCMQRGEARIYNTHEMTIDE